MGAMTLTMPVIQVPSVPEIAGKLRTQRRRVLIAGYKLSLRGRTAASILVWNSLYSVAVRSIPDDLYDWEDDELETLLSERSASSLGLA